MLKLSLDDLQVDSFSTLAEEAGEGTVRAYQELIAGEAYKLADCTKEHTCTCLLFRTCAGDMSCEATRCAAWSCDEVTVTSTCADAG